MKINDLSYNATGARYGYNGTHEQDLELNAQGNYVDFGNFGYDTRVAMRRNQEPLRAKYPNLSNYSIFNSNPIFYKDIDGFDWIKSTGDKVFWYTGNYGDEKTLLKTFKATSGMSEATKVTTLPNWEKKTEIVNTQVAKYQVYKDVGPTPEGHYSINLILDHNRVVEADVNTGELLKGQGIQKIPESVPVLNKPYNFYIYEDWGDYRVRLEPIEVTGDKEHKREWDTFYFHDSQKGYSHGCIEVEPRFFDYLINFKIKNPEVKSLDVKIDYPSLEHKTNGGTKVEN